MYLEKYLRKGSDKKMILFKILGNYSIELG